MDTSRDIRPPSPLHDAVLQHLPLEDPIALRRCLVKLHCLVNSTVPINTLPAEVLAEILRFARLRRPPHWSFTTVLLVCHHWYDIAISWPSLWSDITIAMPLRILEVYSSRSRGAGLSLTTQGGRTAIGAPPDALLRALSPHFHRVAQLDTCSSQPWIEHRMEQLSSLIVNDDIINPLARFAPARSQVITLAGDRFPRLESLILRQLRVQVNLANLRSLTSLTMERVSHASWNALLVALSSCPALQYLEIDSPKVHSVTFPTHGNSDVIKLRYLRGLILDHFDEHSGLSFLLAHLYLPRAAKIAISTDMGEGHDLVTGGFNELSTLIADTIPVNKTFLPVFSAIRDVQVTVSSPRLQVVVSTPKEAPASTPSTSFALSCTLRDRWNTRAVQEQIMLELPMVFPASLSTLHICVKDDDDGNYYGPYGVNLAEVWRGLYDAFPQIEDLCLGGPNAIFFDDFLGDFGPGASLQHLPLPWPKLKRVWFEYTATADGALLGGPDESMRIILAITTTMCNRRDAASAEPLQHLTVILPTLGVQVGMCLSRLRSTTQKLVVRDIRGQGIVLEN
ncbi:uncharacterized protein C8Q71DRAFT_764723 [Rhodofomes roseus]|uniref:F-box domain-containing protein n=1 Tax=Rhodofomes roseus TaxID=34475 RepID=A0ABQ8KD01_9APHY|nr:uncharacterized protein C8Q71DRAFT_764723 [Rhodofomes roseus]KAH9835225.1 hypothetical protein C8Q71DRAFT_764723 [Rhodofomes roseus]